MRPLTRRRFVQAAAVSPFAGFAIAGTKASGRILGANEAIRVGVCGLHGRGGSHVEAFSETEAAQVTYLIDPDTRTFEERLKTLADRRRSSPTCVQDLRKALDDPNLDAVSIASPNHWHALQTIWSCQAGKDVYVEKPASHNVHEGRIALETARKHNCIVQHGTQGRSEPKWWRTRALVESGQLGKLLLSRGLVYKRRDSIGQKPDSAAPSELDYNLWLGPAQERPFNGNYVHYNWHWFWDFGNGDIGNQGVHQMDVARWMIPGAALPRSVVALGGRFGYTDQAETPNTQLALFEFEGTAPLLFEVRGLPTEPYLGSGTGNILHLEAGTIVNGATFIPKGKTEGEPLPRVERPNRSGGGDHFANFLAAVRSRKPADLNAEIEDAHYSSALCHLANLSYRVGEPVPFTSSKEFPCALMEAFDRMEHHLADANKLKLDALAFRLGPTLTFDPKTERFPNHAEANALLTREYRKPFTLTV